MFLRGVAFAACLALVTAISAHETATANDDQKFQATPFTFVGGAAQCGGVAGSRIVTAAWLSGMGLPDNGALNTALTAARDPHFGLLLNKNGITPDCSSSGARITGFNRGTTITELGFDYRTGGHCGAGAPRFNVVTTSGTRYFFGCIYGLHAPAPQDPLQWTRVRFVAPTPGAEGFVFGSSEVQSISIVFDEGTDTASPDDPNGVGLAVLDNIDINGNLITRGPGNSGDNDNNDEGNDHN